MKESDPFKLALERDVPRGMRVAYDCGQYSREAGERPFAGHRLFTTEGVRWWRLGYLDFGREQQAATGQPLGRLARLKAKYPFPCNSVPS